MLKSSPLFIQIFGVIAIITMTSACSSAADGAISQQVFKDIPYVQNGTSAQSLDIYAPKRSNKNLHPVHVYVHGGAWNKGDKSAVKRREALRYTRRGIILISVNYRLAPEFQYPSNIQDLAAMTAWVAKNIRQYGGDPDNVVLSGHSAGAHLVALLGTDKTQLKNHEIPMNYFKAIYPVDTASFDLTKKTESGRLSLIINKMKRQAFGTNKAVLEAASPIHQVTKQQQGTLSPFMLFTTAERSDAVQETKAFATRLKENGHQVSTTILDKNLNHADMNDEIFNPKSVIFSSIIKSLSGQ